MLVIIPHPASRIVQFNSKTMGMMPPGFRMGPPNLANTLSYVTVELRYLCIMWHDCIGYRQNLGKLRCCPNIGVPPRYWRYQHGWLGIEKMPQPVEINGTRLESTIQPKTWPQLGNQLARRKSSPMHETSRALHLFPPGRFGESQNLARPREREKKVGQRKEKENPCAALATCSLLRFFL